MGQSEILLNGWSNKGITESFKNQGLEMILGIVLKHRKTEPSGADR